MKFFDIEVDSANLQRTNGALFGGVCIRNSVSSGFGIGVCIVLLGELKLHVQRIVMVVGLYRGTTYGDGPGAGLVGELSVVESRAGASGL